MPPSLVVSADLWQKDTEVTQGGGPTRGQSQPFPRRDAIGRRLKGSGTFFSQRLMEIQADTAEK
jgi:hypothetical protein